MSTGEGKLKEEEEYVLGGDTLSVNNSREEVTRGKDNEKMKSESIINEDEKELPSYTWNFPRSIPAERISSTESFEIVLKCIKILMYIILFCGVLGSLVLSKGSLLLMTSTLHTWDVASNMKHLEEDTQERTLHGRNTIATCLIICMLIPYGWTFLVYSMKSLFGGEEWPSFLGFIRILVIEFFQTSGLCILIFMVLPRMDMVRACVVLCSTAVIPGIAKMAFGRAPRFRNGSEQKSKWQFGENLQKGSWYALNCIAVISQAASLAIILLFNFETSAAELALSDTQTLNMDMNSNDTTRRDILFRTEPQESTNFTRWYAPLCLVLLSLTWWENFIEKDIHLFGGKIALKRWKEQMHAWRQKSSAIVSLWNMVIIIAFPYVAFTSFTMEIIVDNYQRQDGVDLATNLSPLLTQIFSTFGGYCLGALSCKLCMQRSTFTLPLLLTTPTTLVLVCLQCRLGFIPTFGSPTAFWNCPEFSEKGYDFMDMENNNLWQALCGIIWWLSLMIIAGHVWWPRQNKLDKIEKLFVRPLCCNLLLENALLLNRRRRDHEVKVNYRGNVDYNPDDKMNLIMKEHELGGDTVVRIDHDAEEAQVPRIYACATMWHETRNEMTQLMKSIFRMDKDQSKRRNLREADPTFKDPDYYEWETHILFDDSMTLNDQQEYVPNSFVKQFVEVIDEAGSSVHHCAITLPDPVKYCTPYGGRLIWTLPGGTQLVVHLKDKTKVRGNKRWSQSMYLYYLLAYRLVGLKDDQTWEEDPKGKHRKNTAFVPGSIFRYMPDSINLEATQTYILALDGDVDFKPDAVRLLVDMMKKNPKVGAACGRIHPVGRGPIVWYQDFEYAISHWLQKAAEHVYGCVLCSPGCFSLFRGSCMLDDNVMRKYSTIAESPAEFIQYDQGEDRWLCTLLLQQGYRVEYCAASDALTYAPETFKEFYNQRRRWGPSTMANMVDLLGSFKTTVRKNDNISSIYMLYLMMIFCASILGPGTTLMMIAGSFNTVLGTDLWQSYVMALGPVTFFIIVCFTTRGDTQIIVAAVMSTMYAVVMMVVIVATVANAFQESLTSPNVIFMICLVGSFVCSGILHPQEVLSLVNGFIYFICIPSGYLILPIYSLCNMNVVSWGTREVVEKKSKDEELDEQERKKRQAAKSSGFMAWLGLDVFITELKEFYNTVLGRNKKMIMNNNTSKSEERVVEEQDNPTDSNELQRILRDKRRTRDMRQHEMIEREKTPFHVSSPPVKQQRDEMINPAWIEDYGIGTGRQDTLPRTEIVFWRQLLRFHLHPLIKDKDKQNQTAFLLKTMRTNIVFAYLMINFLWMVVIFQLQLLKFTLEDDFFIPIPRYRDIYGEPERFEPLGLAFLLVFGTTLAIQFSATLIHRCGTFMHVIARTEIYASHNTVEGKLKLAEKLQSIGTVPELDEAFGLPPPDYEDEHGYETTRSTLNNKSDSEQTRIPSKYDYETKARRPPPYRRRDHFDYENRMRREHHRPREFGQLPVGADVLQRNFNRRFQALQNASKHNDVILDIEHGRKGRQPLRGIDHIYHTVRSNEKYYRGKNPHGPFDNPRYSGWPLRNTRA